MKGFSADLKHALRLYRETPASSLIAIAVLAVAMACVVAFLSLYVDIALKPHRGFIQSDRLTSVGLFSADGGLIGTPYSNVSRLADEMTTVDAAAMMLRTTTLTVPDLEALRAALVSAELFDGLGARLELGRAFTLSEHDFEAEPAVILSYRFWQQRYNGRRDVIDEFLELTRDPDSRYQGSDPFASAEPEQESARFRIVGVAAQALAGFPVGTGRFDPDVYMPVERGWTIFRGVPDVLDNALGPVYARRASSATAAQVANELRSTYGGSDSLLGRMPDAELDAVDGLVGNIKVQRDAEWQLGLFLTGSLLLALVAASNVGLFLLARAPARRRELATRMAVGAPVSRLARQLATEAGLLVVVSCLIGFVGSQWLNAYLRSLPLLQLAQWKDVTLLDWRVLGLAFLLLILLTLLISLAPVLGIRKAGIGETGRQSTSRASLAQRVFGTVQIVIAGALGGVAIAFVWQLGVLILGDPGFAMANRFYVAAITRNNASSQDARAIMTERWRESVLAIPGIQAVAFGDPVPADTDGFLLPARVLNPQDPADLIEISMGEIDQDFVDVMGYRVVHGRVPDNSEPYVVAVNQSLARRLWGRDDVVGEVLAGTMLGNPQTGSGSQIVGVLEDVAFGHPAARSEPLAFRSYPTIANSVVVESTLHTADLLRDLKALDPTGLDVEILSVRSLKSMRHELLAPDRVRAFLTMTGSSLVVLLAAFGFYGTQQYLVASGRREYAIRAAIGAGPAALGRLVLTRGLLLALPGIAMGALSCFIVVAWLRGNFLSTDIVEPLPITILLALGLAVLVLAATLVPARHAMRTAPAGLLREG